MKGPRKVPAFLDDTMPLVANQLIVSYFLKILGANGAEDYKQSAVNQSLIDQRERGPVMRAPFFYAREGRQPGARGGGEAA